MKHKLVKPRVHIVKADIAFDSKHKAYVIYLLEVTDEDGKLRWLVGKHLHINIFENTCKILPNEKLGRTVLKNFSSQIFEFVSFELVSYFYKTLEWNSFI